MLYNNMEELIGNTPIVRLSNSGFEKSNSVYAKLELWNPGGSVKDRIGKYMIEDAEKRGILKSGGTIVEGTAGNTGIGIAFAALGRGYKLIMVVPEKFSKEKQLVLKAFGAEVVNTPSEEGMLGAEKKAAEIRDKIPGAVSFEQFRNQSNPLAHYETTGPEIWNDMQGNIDFLVAGAGSGGTYTGVVRYLKEQNPKIKGILADPVGSTIGNIHGVGEHASYAIEGIGNDFIPDTMDMSLVDDVIKINDNEAFEEVRKLACSEGILVGTSGGAALSAVRKLSRQVKNAVIVTILPDRGDRYFSKNIYI